MYFLSQLIVLFYVLGLALTFIASRCERSLRSMWIVPMMLGATCFIVANFCLAEVIGLPNPLRAMQFKGWDNLTRIVGFSGAAFTTVLAFQLDGILRKRFRTH